MSYCASASNLIQPIMGAWEEDWKHWLSRQVCGVKGRGTIVTSFLSLPCPLVGHNSAECGAESFMHMILIESLMCAQWYVLSKWTFCLTELWIELWDFGILSSCLRKNAMSVSDYFFYECSLHIMWKDVNIHV